MATAHVATLPGALDNLGAALGLATTKDKDGKRLIRKFCIPRQPTQGNAALRLRPEDDPDDFARLVEYCRQDVAAEMAASAAMPAMSPDELAFWRVDQDINTRGVAVDVQGVHDCIAVIDAALAEQEAECVAICGRKPSQVAELLAWLDGRGLRLPDLSDETTGAILASGNLEPSVRRVIELRIASASSSVKKLYAIARNVSSDGRLRDLYVHHGARTGRPTGQGAQPTNLPRDGGKLRWDSAGMAFGADLLASPWTGEPAADCKPTKWSWRATEHVLGVARLRSAEAMRAFFGAPTDAVAGCLRGLFVAAPGKMLVSADYTAIEAVVAAAITGETWRLDVFRDRGDIYLTSISRITGTPMSTYLDYAREHGEHHPDRQRGKVAELASGYGGWVNAWRAFGATGDDDEIKAAILAWRKASPRIVDAWGGQSRNWKPDRYGLEGCAVDTIETGRTNSCGPLTFYMAGPHLVMRLPSGRELTYRDAGLVPSDRRDGEWQITFSSENSNPKYGPIGWVRMRTYGGRLFENAVQAIAHDIQRFGIMNLEAAGLPVVLHTYDEMVSEVDESRADVAEYERIMSQMPPWAEGWPIYAAGWKGRRYRKA